MRATGMVRVEGNTPGLQEISESFSLLDYAGGDVRVRGNMNLVRVSKSFVSLRAVGGDLSIDDCPALLQLEHGTFNRVQWLAGSLVIARTGLPGPIVPVQSRERRRGRVAERKRET